MANIILVDDDEQLADSLTSLLKLHGHNVCYRPAPELLIGPFSLLLQGADVVICDWDFGLKSSMTGAEAVKEFQKVNPTAECIILSGLERTVPAGVTFLLKDSIADLVSLIEKLTVDNPAEGVICHFCDLPFTLEEWEGRHSDEDGEDVHERCCQICISTTGGDLWNE